MLEEVNMDCQNMHGDSKYIGHTKLNTSFMFFSLRAAN